MVAALLLGMWLLGRAVPVATEASSGPPSGVRPPGWRATAGSVFLAGSAAVTASWATHEFVPRLAETPLSGVAVGTVAFVIALWGITVFLIPGRRPTSMSARWGDTAWSIAGGLLIAGIAVGSTWAYLASIEIDDGLEGLIFLPILGAASFLVALAARSWSGRFRPVVAAVAACLGVDLVMTVEIWSRSAGPSVVPLYTLTVLLLFPLTLVGVAIGTAIGDYLHNARHARQPPRSARIPRKVSKGLGTIEPPALPQNGA